MFLIPHEEIRGRDLQGVPNGVVASCPLCGVRQAFGLVEWHDDATAGLLSKRTRCVACNRVFRWYYVLPVEADGSTGPEAKGAGHLYLHPFPQRSRRPVQGALDPSILPEGVQRAYTAALDAYNAQNWNAAGAMVGRTLEGMLKTTLPERFWGTLGPMLKALPKQRDLGAPIEQLGDALREGRNLSAHFDFGIETDAETATLMFELLDDLIKYLFVLPRRIESLRVRLTQSDKTIGPD